MLNVVVVTLILTCFREISKHSSPKKVAQHVGLKRYEKYLPF